MTALTDRCYAPYVPLREQVRSLNSDMVHRRVLSQLFTEERLAVQRHERRGVRKGTRRAPGWRLLRVSRDEPRHRKLTVLFVPALVGVLCLALATGAAAHRVPYGEAPRQITIVSYTYCFKAPYFGNLALALAAPTLFGRHFQYDTIYDSTYFKSYDAYLKLAFCVAVAL